MVHEVLARDDRAGHLRAGREPDRGTPAVFTEHGDPDRFGYSAAILASDLVVAWATELLAALS